MIKIRRIKSKLLIATDNFLPRWDGISRFLLEAVPELKRDFEITIIAPNFGDLKEFKTLLKGIRIIKFPMFKKRFGDYYFARLVFSILHREVKNADIVWVQDVGPIGTLAMFFANLHHVRRIAYVHSLEYDLAVKSLGLRGPASALLKSLVKQLIRFVYNRALLLLVPSFEIANLLEELGVRTDKVVIHMGVNTKKFRPFDKRRKILLRKKLKIPKDKFVVGYCGRLACEKDPLTLLKAFLMLKLKNSPLLVVGSGVPKLEEKFKHKKNVKLIGSMNDVVPYLNVMDVYVLPSLTETSSLSTMEAMSCGVPVVVTPVGYLKKYVKNNFNGFFFKPRDYVGLALKLRSLAKRKDLKRLSKNARRTILKHYNIERTIDEVRKVLGNL